MDNQIKMIFDNKRSLKSYDVLKSYEFGIILLGEEVKSLRILNNVQLKNPYFTFTNNCILVTGIFIKLANFTRSFCMNFQQRKRKLLCSWKEFLQIKNLQRTKLLIDRMYWSGSFVKIKVVLVKNKYKMCLNKKKLFLNYSTSS